MMMSFSACDQTPESIECPTGEAGDCYLFQADGPNGELLMEGYLQIEIADKTGEDGVREMAGFWDIHHRIPGAAGPQAGSGLLTGHTRGQEVFMVLSAYELVDEIELHGTIKNEVIEGLWVWMRSFEPIAEGHFIARREQS